jgi:two-component system, LuxR family, sensor kinase FixL
MNAAFDSNAAARGLNIGQRLTLIVLAVAIPMLLLSTAIVWRLAGHQRDQSRDAILYSSRPIMSTVDAQIGKYMAAVQALAVSPSLKLHDLAGFREEAEQALPGLPGAWVTLADAQGWQVVNTLVSTIEPPPLLSGDERTAEIRALEARRMQVSDVLVGGIAKFPTISVGVPILIADKPAYFLAISVDVTVFRALLNSQGLPLGWIVAVIDRRGNIIARSRDHERWVGRPASSGWREIGRQDGLFETLALEGQPVIYANAVSQLNGWTTVVAAEKSALEAPIRETTASAVLVGMVVTMLSIVLAIFAARRITAPIKTLETGVQALQRYEPVIFAATGVPEFDRTLLAFDTASKALLKYEDQRAQAEMALRSSEARLRLFVEQAPASIAMFDRNMRFLAASHRFIAQYCIGGQDVVGRLLYEVLPEIPEHWKERHRRCLNGEVLQGDDDASVRADGRTQWVSWEIRPWRTRDGDIGGIAIFSEDVTSRHEVVEALRESEERLRLLIDGTKDYAVFMLDPKGRIVSWNDGARRIKGYETDEVIGRHVSIFYTPDDIAAGKPERDMEIALLTGAHEQEGELVKKRGERIWANTLVNPIYGKSGTLKGFARITRDITERKKAELALVTSETLLRAVVDGSPDAIIAISAVGVIQSINTNGLEMFGYERQEVVGRNISTLLPEPFRDVHGGCMRNYLQTGQAEITGTGPEVEGVRRDGSVFPLGLVITQTTYDDAPLFVGFLRDLSSRREIEARIKQLQGERLSAMGGLAAGLAHELNQPLAAAATYLETAQLLLEMPADARPDPIENTLASAVDEIMRAGHIMKRLREFVSSGEPDKTFLSLHNFINDASELSIPKKEKIRVSLRLNAKNDGVLADRIQIKQVLANLIRNATEAMGPATERKLSISTSSIEQDMIRVDIADTGSGFQPGVMERLFEPFQSTKSNGMGIGLSISRMIVEAHYGRIWAEPNPQGGAIFSFTLPLVDVEISNER